MSIQKKYLAPTTSSNSSSKPTTLAPFVSSAHPDGVNSDVKKQYPSNLIALLVFLIVITVIIIVVLLIRRKMRLDRLRSQLRPVYRFRASEEELLFERNDVITKQNYYTFHNYNDFSKKIETFC